MAAPPIFRDAEKRGGVRLSGDTELIAKLWALPDKVFKKCLIVASRRAMRPVTAQAKAHAAVQSGALQRSIGVRIKTYKRTGTVVTVVGARGGFAGNYQGRVRNPAFYSHLIEGGHRIVAPHSLKVRMKKRGFGFIRQSGTGRTMGRVEGMPFLRPALVQNMAAIVSSLSAEIGAFVEREAKKSA